MRPGQKTGPPVMEFDAAGNHVQGWGGPGDGYEWPSTEHGIYVDYKGFVWVGGSGNDDQILKFNREGKFVLQIGKRGQPKTNKSYNMWKPADVFVYPKTNELFVADGYGNRRIIVFDADTGAFKRMWGAFGNVPEDSTDPNAGDEGGAARQAPRNLNRIPAKELAANEGRVESYDAQVVSHQLVGSGTRASADFEHTLAAGISQWRVSVTAGLAEADMADALLLDCTNTKRGCVVVDQAVITNASATLVADEPAAGVWRIVIRTRGRAAGPIDYAIRHAALTSSPESIEPSDQKRASGARWSLTVPHGPGDAQYVAYRLAHRERDGGQKGIRIAMTSLQSDAP